MPLGVPLVITLASPDNEVAEMRLYWRVEAEILLVDDIVDTAGTITKAANLMLKMVHARVRAIASHAVVWAETAAGV